MWRTNAGISLLEYVVGLAILAIVLVGAGLFFLSQPRQLDPVFQFRAVSLAEALAEQVLAVKYDANNDLQEQTRCNIDAVSCRNEPSDIAKAAPRLSNFSSVDDFNLWCNESAISGDELADEENLKLGSPQLYSRYRVSTCVTPEDDGVNPPFKKVVVTVEDQNGSDLAFTLHRYNIR